MTTLTVADKVDAYIKIRDFKKSAEDEFKKSMTRVLQAMDKLEAELLDELNKAGVNSMSGASGVAYVNTVMSATVENRENFLDHVRKTKMWEALDVKANKTFVKEYIEEHGESLPGLKVTQVKTVGVRRS